MRNNSEIMQIFKSLFRFENWMESLHSKTEVTFSEFPFTQCARFSSKTLSRTSISHSMTSDFVYLFQDLEFTKCENESSWECFGTNPRALSERKLTESNLSFGMKRFHSFFETKQGFQNLHNFLFMSSKSWLYKEVLVSLIQLQWNALLKLHFLWGINMKVL